MKYHLLNFNPPDVRKFLDEILKIRMVPHYLEDDKAHTTANAFRYFMKPKPRFDDLRMPGEYFLCFPGFLDPVRDQ